MAYQTILRTLKHVTSWGALAIFVFLFFAYLNSAVYSAWVSGGPPTPYPLGWLRRALGHLSFSAAALSVGFALFIGIRQMPKLKKTPLVLLAVGLCLIAAPYVGRAILEDKCVDNGGSWSKSTLQCSNEYSFTSYGAHPPAVPEGRNPE